jgi:hypothetical protein
VPQSHIEGDFKLGRWVNKQRVAYRLNKLSVDRVARLEAVPAWEWLSRNATKAKS